VGRAILEAGERCGGKSAEGQVQRRDRGFLGKALPPGIVAQAPADLHVAGVLRSFRIDPLEPAEAEHFAIRLAFDDPEGVAVLALVGLDPSERGLVSIARPDAAQPTHDCRRVGVAEELVEVVGIPVAQTQPFGLGNSFSHR